MERRADGTENVGSLLALGGAWCFALLVLAWGLPAKAFSLALGTLVLAECLSLILTRARLMPGGSTARQDLMAQALGGWVLLCLAVMAFYRFDLMPFFAGQPLAVLMLLGLTLILSLLEFTRAGVRPTRGHDVARILFWVFLWQAIDYVDELTLDLALGAALLGALSLLLLRMVRQNGKVVPLEIADRRAKAQVNWASYIDLLVFPLLLGGAEALIYLVARAMAQVLIAAVAEIGTQARGSLIASGSRRDSAGFNALAARLNLGILLVGGGLGVVLLTAGDYLPNVLGYDLSGLGPVLGWLLLAGAAPAFFGATDTLMGVSAMHRQATILHLAAAVFFCATVFGIGQISALVMAQTYAVCALAQALLAAVLLARSVGVWPGLTAILLRQIKLL